MKLTRNISRCLCLVFGLWMLVACNSVKHELPPTDLPTAPNCAADGPGCKQFNPDKPEQGESNY